MCLGIIVVAMPLEVRCRLSRGLMVAAGQMRMSLMLPFVHCFGHVVYTIVGVGGLSRVRVVCCRLGSAQRGWMPVMWVAPVSLAIAVVRFQCRKGVGDWDDRMSFAVDSGSCSVSVLCPFLRR